MPVETSTKQIKCKEIFNICISSQFVNYETQNLYGNKFICIDRYVKCINTKEENKDKDKKER